MSTPPLPENETERLASLSKMQILDRPAEDRFDRLTRLGCRLMRAPFAMLTLIDETRQWFKSACGHMVNEAPRATSFCTYTIREQRPLVVPDAQVDSRFFAMPVVQDWGVRFYAGIPIYSQERQAIGTFCILDLEPRELDADDLRALQDLAACAESELQLMRTTQSEQELIEEMNQVKLKASVDPITRCWNQDTILTLVDKEREACRLAQATLCLVAIGLHGIPDINERLGQAAGDTVLREMAERLRTPLQEGDLLGRLSGPRFLVLTRTPLAEIESLALSLVEAMSERPVKVADQAIRVGVSAGVALLRGPTDLALDCLSRAEKAERSVRQSAGQGVAMSV